MRKVILFMHVSLDGFVCGPKGEQDWMTMNDDEMGRFLANDFQKTADTILTGRILYEGFASYWPKAAQGPAMPAELVSFAKWMEDTHKVVFSRTLKKAEWANSTLAQADPVEEVARLKKQKGGDMIIFGGAGIVSYFTSKDLVDEYRLKLEPVILGTGKPLFRDMPGRQHLKLLLSKQFASGVVGLYYQRIRS
jgi:dihydrofolate reductase